MRQYMGVRIFSLFSPDVLKELFTLFLTIVGGIVTGVITKVIVDCFKKKRCLYADRRLFCMFVLYMSFIENTSMHSTGGIKA